MMWQDVIFGVILDYKDFLQQIFNFININTLKFRQNYCVKLDLILLIQFGLPHFVFVRRVGSYLQLGPVILSTRRLFCVLESHEANKVLLKKIAS